MKELEIVKTKKLIPPKNSEFLWRYFDLHKFLSLLNEKNIRFARMDEFEDPLEGIPLSALITYEEKVNQNLIPKDTTLSQLILDQTLFGSLPILLQKKLNQIHAIQLTTFVSCWFYEQRESMAMWNLYSDSNGVAIKLPYGKLISQLKETNFNHHNIGAFYTGRVDYQNFKTVSPYVANEKSKIPKVALRKDSSFSHEKEVRFVIRIYNDTQKTKSVTSGSLNLRDLEMKVVCHPRMNAWKKENIKSLLRKAGIENAFQVSEIKLR